MPCVIMPNYVYVMSYDMRLLCASDRCLCVLTEDLLISSVVLPLSFAFITLIFITLIFI